MERVLKKEDGFKYKGGFFRNKKGSLVLTSSNLYFATKRGGKRVFDIPLADIVSVNAKKGFGNGVEHLFVLYNASGSEKKAKIEYFSTATWAGGFASRIAPPYFTGWEQMINDARFGKLV